MAYRENRIDIVEFEPTLKFDIPLAIDDMSLAHHLGIRNKTLWWLTRIGDKGYHVFTIPKRRKGQSWREVIRPTHEGREIQNPIRALKYTQVQILTKILDKIPTGAHVGAYVTGRSTLDTAKQHVGKAVIVSMDIKDFFPSVKFFMVRRYLNYIGYPHRVSSILTALMTHQKRVPQGAPTSGAIANLVADNLFDRQIIRALAALDPQWTYTRYSDDIDVSHPDNSAKKDADRVIALVSTAIQNAGFRVNDAKTKVETQARRQQVLGVVVNEKPNIARHEYLRLRAIIHNCRVFGFDTQFERAGKASVAALYSFLKGKIVYIKHIAPEAGEKLTAQLEDAMDAEEARDAATKS